ncbi:hypothetical protein RND71_026406 [Anisodus tanguticus]|uniref:Uncharacterized protein n=1 Tax=Anisodus tanguticus TaxID=243964 RepID=A0AAE1RNV0_9SOLA|nr:hypothetical protein RND71_026406 [Anisodus tanguticus]
MKVQPPQIHSLMCVQTDNDRDDMFIDDKTIVSKLYFDLVESGEYKNYPWGNHVFRQLLDTVSHHLNDDTTYYGLGGFPFAMQTGKQAQRIAKGRTSSLLFSSLTPYTSAESNEAQVRSLPLWTETTQR